MTETQKAYLAAILEGEGHLAIRRNNRRDGGHCYIIRVVVTMTDKRIMSYVSGLMGVTLNGPYNRDVNRKPMYGIQAHGLKAQQIIRDIFPYLQGKIEIAELMLLFPVIRGGNQRALSNLRTIQKRLYDKSVDLRNMLVGE